MLGRRLPRPSPSLTSASAASPRPPMPASPSEDRPSAADVGSARGTENTAVAVDADYALAEAPATSRPVGASTSNQTRVPPWRETPQRSAS